MWYVWSDLKIGVYTIFMLKQNKYLHRFHIVKYMNQTCRSNQIKRKMAFHIN